MIICITGTPGTGKTYFAKLLEKKSGFRYLDLNMMIKDERLFDRYDRSSKTYDVDVKKLSKFLGMLLKKYKHRTGVKENSRTYSSLKNFIGKEKSSKDILKIFHNSKHNIMDNIIIDSHLSHYIAADYCIVMRSGIKALHVRLAKRGYSKRKIEDNVQSEIFGICLEEAKSMKQNIIIINS